MDVNTFFDQVSVINLERRPDRLLNITKELSDNGIAFNRVEAIDAVQEGIEPKDACRLSHLKVLNQSKGKTLILEDDATFMPDFVNNFNVAIQTLPDDWDILYLGAYVLKSERVNEQWIRLLRCSSTHAYCLNPDKMDYFKELVSNFDGHVDVAYSNVFSDIKAYAAQPTLVKQTPSYSDILNKDVDYLDWYK